MTKIGEGGGSQEARLKVYQEDVEKSSVKFNQALDGYQLGDAEEKAKFKAFMDEQLQIINAAVREIKRSGVHKQEVKLENDYKDYIKTGSEESFSALKHDLQTLRDYTQPK